MRPMARWRGAPARSSSAVFVTRKNMTRLLAIRVGFVAIAGCQPQSPPGTAAVSSEDLLSDEARVELRLPAKAELTLATDADRERANRLGREVTEAVGTFLESKDVEWQIVAARPVGTHILLWVAFPKIADGGVDLIYSVEKKRIVGEFLGGYRG